jgi:4-oxalocrotonate tautomerase
MPHVVVKIWPGNSELEKRELSEKILKDVSGILKCAEKYISVAVEEIQPEDWTEKVYRPEIAPNLDKLYVKPGYNPLE